MPPPEPPSPPPFNLLDSGLNVFDYVNVTNPAGAAITTLLTEAAPAVQAAAATVVVAGVAASVGVADAKPFVLPGISAGERDPVAAHLEGALAALEAIIFVPKVQPRGVPQQHETRTVEVAALEPAHADQSRGSYWKSATLIVLLVLSVLIAVVALIVSVSLE